ncbi:hypothetical protein F4678DRAFT_464763 [Xylaria arbuscula]|nr:hypothetical protein F4678DRAFT_464763 [Xylaria arbuscula]
MSSVSTASRSLQSPKVQKIARKPSSLDVSPCSSPPAEERRELVDNHSPDASSDIKKMKVYLDGKLYSIYDRTTKSYIYKADRDAAKGWRIVCDNNGRCVLIEDKDGYPVYVRPKESARY